jgi:hypothetical protein
MILGRNKKSLFSNEQARDYSLFESSAMLEIKISYFYKNVVSVFYGSYCINDLILVVVVIYMISSWISWKGSICLVFFQMTYFNTTTLRICSEKLT